MLRITFRGDQKRFIEAMRTKGVRIVETLSVKLNALMFMLGSYVQTEKLSGQVLTPRSGKLRGSVTVIPTHVEGSKLVGAVESSGGVSFYGKIHEYGGSRRYEIMSVKDKALRFLLGGKETFAARVSHPPLPARPFMEPSLTENAPRIISELNEAVNRVIDEKE